MIKIVVDFIFKIIIYHIVLPIAFVGFTLQVLMAILPGLKELFWENQWEIQIIIFGFIVWLCLSGDLKQKILRYLRD